MYPNSNLILVYDSFQCTMGGRPRTEDANTENDSRGSLREESISSEAVIIQHVMIAKQK